MLWHGKNFRGFLNHALQVLFDNTGTTLQSTNVEDAIKEVNSNLSKNNWDPYIDISSYTSSSNYYEIPTDGYINVNSGTSKQVAEVIVGDSHGNQYTALTVTPTGTYQGNLVFVRKGMRAYVTHHPVGSYTSFLPLTDY